MAEKITAELRTEFGKGAARRIRREHKIPAGVYGHGNDPIHLSLPGHDTMLALKRGGTNALLVREGPGCLWATCLGHDERTPRDRVARRGDGRRPVDHGHPDGPGSLAEATAEV